MEVGLGLERLLGFFLHVDVVVEYLSIIGNIQIWQSLIWCMLSREAAAGISHISAVIFDV
jgi:hypothetical protein